MGGGHRKMFQRVCAVVELIEIILMKNQVWGGNRQSREIQMVEISNPEHEGHKMA
jgi:hypothetical protein